MCLKHVESDFTLIQNENGCFLVVVFCALPQKGPFAPPPHGWCLPAKAPLYTISITLVFLLKGGDEEGRGYSKISKKTLSRLPGYVP